MKVLRALVALACLVGAATATWAQPSYLLSAKKDGTLSLGIGSLAAGNLWSGQQLQGFTEAELAALDASGVPAWDRWSLNRWDETAAHRSDLLFYSAAAWSSAAVLLPAWKEKNVWASMPTAVMWVEMNALTLVATDLTKNLVSRPRPFTYFSGAPLEARMDFDARKSFFSGHTSMTAANSFYAAKVLFFSFRSRWLWPPHLWALGLLVHHAYA